MSEPFDIEETPTPSSSGPAQQPRPTWKEQVRKAWCSAWGYSLIIGRKNETVIQLPVLIAIPIGIMGGWITALGLFLGIVLGYSFRVVSR